MRTCKREQEMVLALRAGAWSEDLHDHARECAACAETERVTRALLASAEAVHSGLRVPDADRVWHRAQSRAREAALRRATRPLRVMRTLSIACLAVAAVWMAAQFQGTLSGRFAAMGGWQLLTAGAPVSIEWLSLLLSLIVAGTWCLWYAGRRVDTEGRRMTT